MHARITNIFQQTKIVFFLLSKISVIFHLTWVSISISINGIWIEINRQLSYKWNMMIYKKVLSNNKYQETVYLQWNQLRTTKANNDVKKQITAACEWLLQYLNSVGVDTRKRNRQFPSEIVTPTKCDSQWNRQDYERLTVGCGCRIHEPLFFNLLAQWRNISCRCFVPYTQCHTA